MHETRIYLVTNDGLFDQKDLNNVKYVFIFLLILTNASIIYLIKRDATSKRSEQSEEQSKEEPWGIYCIAWDVPITL